MLDALDIAHGEIQKLVRRPARAGREGRQAQARDHRARRRRGPRRARSASPTARRWTPATSVEDKLERQDATKTVEEEVLDAVLGRPDADTYAEYRARAQLAFDTLEKHIIRERIAVHKKRPDGRVGGGDPPDRDRGRASCRARTAPALFQRGQTQILSVVALGTTREEMRLDNLGLETSKRYFHHYNFPPFSVGRGRLHARPQAPRHRPRRARRARAGPDDPVAGASSPTRSASCRRSLESNGSSSMASVCGSSLSLMDAGVPIKAPGGGRRHGPDQGGRRLHRPDRHRRRGGPPRRHGLQGRRHASTASPPSRWTSRSRA